ncbi:MAG: hypothetical protein RMJ56_00415 [Gemmataceae bacterium]|nr:hypothetical protein [Gemmata sp.]MDW8196043.1 hypothetical protein [Gemmataceae bacterium]
MAQQLITLEEAATILGLTPEDLRRLLKTDPDFIKLSQIRDGSTIRLKRSAIEELARQRGAASSPDLQLAPLPTDAVPSSDEFEVPASSKSSARLSDDPIEFDTSEDDIFQLSEDAVASESQSRTSAGSKTGSDSDVRLDSKKPTSDSSDESAIPTEEITLDLAGPGSAVIKSGSSAKLTAPKSGKLSAGSASQDPTQIAAPDSSEFELNLDADSSDFELQLESDSSEEVDLGTMPQDKPGSSGKALASKSGINLRDPADSGIPLAKDSSTKNDTNSDSDVDFELSVDESLATASGTKLGAPQSGSQAIETADSDSEFELTLDDSSGSSLEHAALGDAGLEEVSDKGDIFETDFEIPPMPDESASEAVAIDSDTDLEAAELATEASDVVLEPDDVAPLTDEDEEIEPVTRRRSRRLLDDDDDEGGIATALAGVKKRSRDEDEDEDETLAAGATLVERPTQPWGVLPALVLAPSVVVILLGAIIGYELLNTMWGYQQPRKPAAPLIRGIASTLDMELRDQ